MQVAELEVVIKGSNAGLTTILDESKNKVKDTAGKMSDDVEKSSKSMRESLLGAFKSVGQVATQTGLALSAAITAPLVKAGHDIVKTFGAFDEGLLRIREIGGNLRDERVRPRQVQPRNASGILKRHVQSHARAEI